MSSSPQEVLVSAGQQAASIYTAYKNLSLLTRHLQGLADSAPLPEGLVIKQVDITFETAADGPRVAIVKTVKRVGDIAPLLQLETDTLVDQLRETALRARQSIEAIELLCNQAAYIVNAQRSGMPV